MGWDLFCHENFIATTPALHPQHTRVNHWIRLQLVGIPGGGGICHNRLPPCRRGQPCYPRVRRSGDKGTLKLQLLRDTGANPILWSAAEFALWFFWSTLSKRVPCPVAHNWMVFWVADHQTEFSVPAAVVSSAHTTYWPRNILNKTSFILKHASTWYLPCTVFLHSFQLPAFDGNSLSWGRSGCSWLGLHLVCTGRTTKTLSFCFCLGWICIWWAEDLLAMQKAPCFMLNISWSSDQVAGGYCRLQRTKLGR